MNYLVFGVLALLGPVALELVSRALMRARAKYYVHRPYTRREAHIATDVLPGLTPIARFRANGDGERGDPVPADPTRVERVLVCGGSAAECFMLDQDETWSAVLQRSLQQRLSKRAVHVGNVARSLIPVRVIDALLERSLRHFRSIDTIVLMVGASDLVRWFEDGVPETVEPRPADYAPDLTLHCDEHPEGPFRWTVRGSATYRFLRRLNTRFRGEVEVRQGAGASIAKHRRMRAEAKELITEVPDPTSMLAAYEADLERLIETCGRFAKRVLVVRQPWLDRDFTPEEEARLWNFGTSSPYRGKVETYFAIGVVRELMGRIDEVTEQVAARLGHDTVDLFESVPSDFDHYYDFLHFTPHGARVVGEAVARALAPVREGQVVRREDRRGPSHLRSIG